MFQPDQIMFAPTGQCNLHCGHCRVPRPASRLEPAAAIAFMEMLRPHGVDRIGFTGGEPFLEPEFLVAVCEAAIRLDFRFDRLMTNAVWESDPAKLRATLGRLVDAGYDGIVGISYDGWHGQDAGEIQGFLEALFDMAGRKDGAQLVWVDGCRDKEVLAGFRSLAKGLGGQLLVEGKGQDASMWIFDPEFAKALMQNRRGFAIGPESLHIPIIRIPWSPPPGNARAWSATTWFGDDFCEGPGNTFYVHPDGRIAVCCGFGNENDELVIGRLGYDTYDSLMERAAALPQVKACYEEGLATVRARLAAEGVGFPGIATDPCVFCDWLCSRSRTAKGGSVS